MPGCRILGDFVDKVENLADQKFREIPIAPRIAAACPVGPAYECASDKLDHGSGGYPAVGGLKLCHL